MSDPCPTCDFHRQRAKRIGADRDMILGGYSAALREIAILEAKIEELQKGLEAA